MMKLRFAALNLIIQSVLQVTAALGNLSGIRKSYKNKIFVTELAEEIYIVRHRNKHDHSLHPVLIYSKLKKNTQKYVQYKNHTVQVNVIFSTLLWCGEGRLNQQIIS